MEIVNSVWRSPLPGCLWSLPVGKAHPAAFGAKRQFNLHTGVDLHCEHMQPVAAVEEGTVVAIATSNNKKKSPWLNQSKAISIEGKSGIVVYCNVVEIPGLEIGMKIESGSVFANVVKVYKKKNNALCMLHLELYKPGTKKRVIWSYNYPKPPQLLDPSKMLLEVITNSNKVYKRR